MMALAPEGQALLGPDDPAPAEILAGAPDAAVALVCEHAGRAIPAALGDLGMPPGEVDRHIGWDIGAASVTRGMARRLGAPAVLQRYSRMVIDCNRPLDAPDSIPPRSDGTDAPGNVGLGVAARAARGREIFAPFDDSVTRMLAAPGLRLALAIHSFTPRLGGVDRPWDVGLLYRRDLRAADLLDAALARRAPGLRIGRNVPYAIDDLSDWFVPVHGEGTGLPHALIEIRNDLIADDAGAENWAALLSACVEDILPELPR